jgi:cell wall-associated NlpC family hydrolase
MFALLEEVKFAEPNLYEVYLHNQNQFKSYNGYRNNCSNTVRTFLSLIGKDTSIVTPWADTVRKMGQVLYDPKELKKGDIVAMGVPGDTWHVGVYLGEGKVLHQSAMRGYIVGAYYDLQAFINHRSGFYFVRPKSNVQEILKDQFYISPELS